MRKRGERDPVWWVMCVWQGEEGGHARHTQNRTKTSKQLVPLCLLPLCLSLFLCLRARAHALRFICWVCARRGAGGAATGPLSSQCRAHRACFVCACCTLLPSKRKPRLTRKKTYSNNRKCAVRGAELVRLHPFLPTSAKKTRSRRGKN